MRKIYYNSIMARLFLWVKGKNTATFFGFICTKHKSASPLSASVINHEAIHVEQYKEVTAAALLMAVVLSPLFGWMAWPYIAALLLFYLISFVVAGISWVFHAICRSKNAVDISYRNSMFEMEAYAHENNIGYIPDRKPFYWLHYIGKV